MHCEDISADWAAQRIKGLTLFSALVHAISPKAWLQRHDQKTIKTLIDTFRYPRKGPGMLWEACAEKIKQRDGKIYLGSKVFRCEYQQDGNQWEIFSRDTDGNIKKTVATHVISSAPLREMVLDYLHPSMSLPAMRAAHELQYRDFLIVVLILKDRNQFPDNWIYIHDTQVDVARIQNFKSWSPDMVPQESMCSYGMEYFCFHGDHIWSAEDCALIQKATQEIVKLGLARADDILDGCVVRQPKAYPVYDNHYQTHVEVIKRELEVKFPSLYLIGRNGMHKYNNQDHAMMTAMLTVKNIIAKKRTYDVWRVNQDAEYIEAGTVYAKNGATGLRDVPERIY